MRAHTQDGLSCFAAAMLAASAVKIIPPRSKMMLTMCVNIMSSFTRHMQKYIHTYIQARKHTKADLSSLAAGQYSQNNPANDQDHAHNVHKDHILIDKALCCKRVGHQCPTTDQCHHTLSSDS